MGIARLTCAAPHPDRPGQTCNSLLAYGDGFTIVGTAHRAPEDHQHSGDGTVWMRCHRSSCQAWTQFKIPERAMVA